MASPEKHPSNSCTFLPIYGLSKSCLRSTAQSVGTDEQGICANVKEEQEDHNAKPQMRKPSSSSFVFLPFHGLSRGCFSPPQQGESIGVQSRKRKADMDQADGVELSAKRLKQDETFCEAEENSDSCHSNAEAAGKLVSLSTSEQSLGELITKQKEVCCSKPKGNYDKEKNAVYGSCLQEDVSENAVVHSQISDGIVHACPGAWDVEVGEQHSSNSDPVCSNVPSVSVQAESNEHNKDNGSTSSDVPSGSKDPANTMALAKQNPSYPCTFLPIYGLSKSCLRSTAHSVSTDEQGICPNVKEEKQDHSTKSQMSKPSSSSFACLPFHGLSRGCFSPPQQGDSTGVQSRKRKADMDQADGVELSAKRLKQNDTFCEAEENSDSCHSRAKDAGSKSDTEMKPRCNINDDNTESDGGNDSSSSESIEWHDALEDAEP
ncbi:uncharacterized protein LOC116300062 [Actinia tenebrosa]|uniref:Uncharacterized protein LOC116300062 n=1 Tax=Actinia tenebrosa TaxID=6105 RepID=A0A6P8IDX6_ACTTE|nr:uncharacterized protein LOC116300062 [Actinia tenebrosa]